MKKGILFLGFLALILSLNAYAVPQFMNFQGRLTSSDATPITTQVDLQFKIYEVGGGYTGWSETWSAVKPDKNGVFNVLLGTINPLNLDFKKNYEIGVKVGTDPDEMTPKQRFAAVPYALYAVTAESLSGGGNYVLKAGDKMQGTLTLEGSANLLVNGSVGIGTTGPEAKLDVNGTAKIAKVLTAAQDLGATLTSADFGKTITVNSSSAQTVYLPDIDGSNIGGTFTIVKLGTGAVTIDAGGTDVIANSGQGDTIYNNVAGEVYADITLQVAADGKWVIAGGHGTWITTD